MENDWQVGLDLQKRLYRVPSAKKKKQLAPREELEGLGKAIRLKLVGNCLPGEKSRVVCRAVALG